MNVILILKLDFLFLFYISSLFDRKFLIIVGANFEDFLEQE